MTDQRLDAPPTLPAPLTRFFGQEEVLAATRSLISRPEVRLVTITGPGGCGKTRLALEVARAAATDFRDGVRFVSLAPIRDPRLVLESVAQTIGTAQARGGGLLSALEEHLRGRRLLLVLDNMEQVIDAAADLATLLGQAEGVTALVTSRVLLRIRGEHHVDVPPLTTPGTGERATARTVAATSAGRLFLDRAAAADPTFALSDRNAETVAAICRQLDGLPLAIELAAARLSVLSLGEVHSLLADQLRLLSSGQRDLPPRQRTLRDTIAWSYDLLSAADQQLFRRLGVFAGSFSLAAASEVGGTDGRNDPGAEEDGRRDILTGMTALVENSLVRRVSGGGTEEHAESRFTMFESIREFAWAQAVAAGEAEAIRRLHARYVLAFAEGAAGLLIGGGQAAWLDRVEQDHPDVRAALKWAIEQRDLEIASRLAGAMWVFWFLRGYLREGRQQVTDALALVEGRPISLPVARLLTGAGALAELQGDAAEAERLLDQAIAAARSIDAPRELATALFFRGLVAFDAGDAEQTVALGEESLRRFRELGDNWGTALALAELGMVALRRDQFEEATRLLEESRRTFAEYQIPWGLALATANLGVVALERRAFARAEALLAEGLALFRTVGDQWGIAMYLDVMARSAREQGHHDRAARLFGAHAAVSEQLGAAVKPIYRRGYELNLRAAREALGDRRFRQLWDEGRALKLDQIVSLAASASTPVQAAPQPFVPLSRREREVLELVVAGRSDRQIADALYIGVRTAQSHVASIFNKLGVNTRTAAAVEALRLGLVGAPTPA